MNLPEPFLENMKLLLEDEFAAFLSSLEEGRRHAALRVNRLKMTPEQFEEAAPFTLERVPWTENGYYVDYRDLPGQHPWYRAGLYYLQEPSAMAPAQILPVEPGLRVLDVCAAPGGKATELGARLSGRGILVANEISASRARALVRNLELFGIRNCIVTNEAPFRLARRFPGYFDRILVDAPCSGEGMFRKTPEAVSTWSEKKVAECARIQREILQQAADMLRGGGYLVYSTCTFDPLENELAVADLLMERSDLELVEIPLTQGRETFSKAFSMEALCRKGMRSAGEPEPDLTKAVRIWPHHASGEGHFIALLRKKTDVRCTAEPLPRAAGRGRIAASQRTGSGRISKQERQLISDFLCSFKLDSDIDINRCEIRDGRVFILPEDCPDLKGVHLLRAGLCLGEVKKNRFEPSQELAMAMPAPEAGSSGMTGPEACTEDPEQRQYIDDGRYIRIPSEDEKLAAFLKGEPLRPESAGNRGSGWRLICADRWPVGWGKMAGGVLKNHIPAGWRNR